MRIPFRIKKTFNMLSPIELVLTLLFIRAATNRFFFKHSPTISTRDVTTARRKALNPLTIRSLVVLLQLKSGRFAAISFTSLLNYNN